MNSNKLFSVILGFISAFLILPKIKPVAGFLIMATVSYGIWNNKRYSYCKQL